MRPDTDGLTVSATQGSGAMRTIKRAVFGAEMPPGPGVLHRPLRAATPGYTGPVTADPAVTSPATTPAVIPALPSIPRERHKRANLIAVLSLAAATIAVIAIVIVAITLR